MGNGGILNACSPGQFLNNPAGLACSNEAPSSQSFASTNFYNMKSKILSDQFQDAQISQTRTQPGLTLFSQSYRNNNSNQGLWGSINQFNLDKSLSINGALSGTAQISAVQSDFSVGLFFAQSYENYSWGVSLAVKQKEISTDQFFKFALGSAYTAQKTYSIATEQLVTLRTGVIQEAKPFRHALVLQVPSYSLAGKIHRDSTYISTTNVFFEESQQGSMRSFSAWNLIAATEYTFPSENTLAIDLNWTSAESTYFDSVIDTDSSAPQVSAGIYSQIYLKEKVFLLSGLRWQQTTNEMNSQEKITSPLVTFGILRKYKGVEICSGFGYSQSNYKKYQKDTNTYSQDASVERFDLILSSSFLY